RPLRRLVVDGEMSIGQLTAHGAALRNVELKIAGSGGVFTLNPFRLDLYEGDIEVTGNFDVRQDRPEAAITLKAGSIEVGPLLRDSLDKEILEGTMGAVADIKFRGDTAPAVKKSLNGSGTLTFVDGAIVGIDIAATARNFAAGLGSKVPEKKPRTDFAELQVPFVLENGVFKTENTTLRSPLLRVKAMGSADMVSERLDMRVRTKIVGTLKGQGDTQDRTGLTVPLLVEGTFADPQYSADLSGLLSEETLKEAVKNPEATKEKIKSLEDTGKQLLKGFGFGD
ncbi:MAG TPA: AsmA family protein, partial [Desulfopila sp.]|nr:AsmA family protein [Desulfopila sp.]